jgi:ADP-L-glycero-D-manno-heptose 6-epimerase
MIIVTGGAGFIGSNLLAALEARGATELVVNDSLGNDDKWRNIAKRELADIVPPDRLLDFLDAHAEEIEVVFHMGANSSTTERDVESIVASNIMLSLDLWTWCAHHGKRLIYASSAATYGDGGQGFDDDGSIEGLAKLRPLNPYGWTKHLVDRRIARLVASGAPSPSQWAGLKFFNAYGPNEYHKGDMRSLIAKSYARAAAGEPVHLFRSDHPDYEDGGQQRDFVWVGDCVEIMLWLYDNPAVNGLFNAGSGNARSFRELIEALFVAADQTPNIDYVDMPDELAGKYQYYTKAGLDRLRAAGYDHPATTVENGVAEYVRDYLSRPDPYR